jgi:hypothetical protein
MIIVSILCIRYDDCARFVKPCLTRELSEIELKRAEVARETFKPNCNWNTLSQVDDSDGWLLRPGLYPRIVPDGEIFPTGGGILFCVIKKMSEIGRARPLYAV